MKIIILFFAILFSTPLFAQASCLDAKKVEAMKDLFNVQRWNGREFLHLDNSAICSDDEALYKLFESLILLDTLPGSDASSTDSIVAEEGPMDFFKNRIRTIFIEDSPLSATCENDTTIAYVRPKVSNTTFVCAKAFSGISTYQRATSLVHEARHIDGYPHADCTHGSMFAFGAGRGACDTDFPLQGSYGVEAGFNIFVAKSAADPVLKQQARAEAIDLLVNRFNTYPWDLKEGILAQEFSGDISFLDGKTKSFLFKGLSAAILTARLLTPTFFTFDGDVKSVDYSESMLTDTPGSFAEDFRKKTTPAQRSELLAVKYSINYVCQLYTTYLYCEDEGSQTISFSNIEPLALLQTSDLKSPVVLIDRNGAAYQLPAKITEGDWSEAGLKRSTSGMVLLSVAKIGRAQFGLSKSNQVMQYSDNQKRWVEVPVYRTERFRNMVPYIWSQKLQEL